MPELVALDLAGGPAFVDALRRVWDAGDAALPVDQRLPPPAKSRLLDAMAPARVVAGEGSTKREGSLPTEDGDALVVATSGTTGPSKGVVLTHDAVAAHARAVHQRLALDAGSDHWLACLPLAHVGGLGVVTRALVDGVALTVQPGFDRAAVVAAASAGATLVSLVPTALDRLGGDANRFRWIVVGGSGDWRIRGPNVVHTYGMTETGGGIVYDGEPLEGVEVAVDDEGQIRLRGPMLARAYRDGTPLTGPDGWYDTGDLGAWDGEYLVVHGRADDLIITGGEKVWPAAVEAALATHGQVAAVAVAGRRDPKWGQQVVAWVVPTDAARPPSLSSLREHVKQVLPAFAAPPEVVIVDDLPRTALGKVRRDRLR